MVIPTAKLKMIVVLSQDITFSQRFAYAKKEQEIAMRKFLVRFGQRLFLSVLFTICFILPKSSVSMTDVVKI